MRTAVLLVCGSLALSWSGLALAAAAAVLNTVVDLKLERVVVTPAGTRITSPWFWRRTYPASRVRRAYVHKPRRWSLPVTLIEST